MKKNLKTACIQLNNTPDLDVNLAASAALVRQAAAAGAEFICTPEYTCLMREVGGDRLSFANSEENHKVLRAYCDLARELKVWILLGSISVKIAPDKMNNRSFLIDGTGNIVARYNKIHMFDVDLPNGQSFRESKFVQSGDKAVIADSPWGKIGMTICYDVRFAYLYRALAHAGATILTVPSAFSIPTGSAHWEIFLRTRAAETGCFVIAPGQCGLHEGTRRTWGHSMIVDPWGVILAERREDTPGILMADLDLSRVDEVRANVPALTQDRAFTIDRQGG